MAESRIDLKSLVLGKFNLAVSYKLNGIVELAKSEAVLLTVKLFPDLHEISMK